MKTLFLLRHAKSNKAVFGMSDFDRDLSDPGIEAAKRMGKFMTEKAIHPNLVLSSPAERAKQTAMLAINASGMTMDLRFDERIYDASVAQLKTVVRQIEENANVVMLVGHNPGFEDLQTSLTGDERHMPTAALASLTLEVENWNDVTEGCAKLDWMISPKELKQD